MWLLFRLLFNCSLLAIFIQCPMNAFGTMHCVPRGLRDILRRLESLLVVIPKDGDSVWLSHGPFAPEGSVTPRGS